MQEPDVKRAIAFVDGQNLYRHAKDAFGYHFPNYDVHKLLNAICVQMGWSPFGVRFYTGTPSAARSPMWHGFWASKLLAMRRSGVFVFSRQIRYSVQQHEFPDGSLWEIDSAQEKGVDVRLAIDVMRMTYSGQFDVAVIFSQDQDLTEVVDEIKDLSRTTGRWIKICSAFPVSATASTNRGINGTDWFKMDKAFYDRCLDPHDYRPNGLVATAGPPVPPIRLIDRP